VSDLFVLTFHTTHGALRTAEACCDAGLPHETIPIPRALSSECGFAVQIGPVAADALSGIVRANHSRIAGCYRVVPGQPQPTYQLLPFPEECK